MKHFYLLSLFISIGLFCIAQQNLTFPYQALVRDATGNPVTNQQISAKITLLSDSLNGSAVYEETHAATTNGFGQINLQIGSENNTAFDTINWGSGPMFIKLEVDLDGGDDFQEIGTHQLLAVPFAKYAEEAAGWKRMEDGIGFRDGKVIIGAGNPVKELTLNGDLFIKKTTAADDTMSIFLYEEGLSGIALNYLAPENRLDINGTYDNAQSNIMTLTRTGEVGIGTSTPEYRLDVRTNMPTPGTFQTQRWSTWNDDYNLKLLTIWDENGINQKIVQLFNGTNYDVIEFYHGSCYINNQKTSSLGLQSYIKNRDVDKFNSLSKNDITNVISIIEQDSLIDPGKLDIFLIEKIDQLIQSNIQQQNQIENLQSEIENLKNK